MKRNVKVPTDQELKEYEGFAAASMIDAVEFARAARERKAQLRGGAVIPFMRTSQGLRKGVVAA